MHMTPKIADALQALQAAPHHRLGRCQKGFGKIHGSLAPTITRRTGNQLVNAGLADYNDRLIPSAITLTAKGLFHVPSQAAA